MRTKPIVLYSYSCCDLGSLAVAPGDSQRRARPARANHASDKRVANGPAKGVPARLPLLARSPAASPGLPAATISSGLRHRRYPRRRPYPNRTRPPCTCPYHPYDDASSSGSDRHPLSEGSRPGTGMQGYLPQATIAASEPLRSSGASAGTPKHAGQQDKRPPIADRRERASRI